MKFVILMLAKFYLFFQNPLEDENNYKTHKKSKKQPLNSWLMKNKKPKSYKMNQDSLSVFESVFFKGKDSVNTKGLNYKMPNN